MIFDTTRRQLSLPFKKTTPFSLHRKQISSKLTSQTSFSNTSQAFDPAGTNMLVSFRNSPCLLKKEKVVVNYQPRTRRQSQVQRERSKYSVRGISKQMPDCFKTTRHWFLKGNVSRVLPIQRTFYQTNIFGQDIKKSFNRQLAILNNATPLTHQYRTQQKKFIQYRSRGNDRLTDKIGSRCSELPRRRETLLKIGHKEEVLSKIV